MTVAAVYIQGKVFRREFVRVVGGTTDPDVIVECSGAAARPGSNKSTHNSVFLKNLARATFCPVLPGDEQNSQHVVDRYLAGCIPVFPGPPYHALPFEKEVRPSDRPSWEKSDCALVPGKSEDIAPFEKPKLQIALLPSTT